MDIKVEPLLIKCWLLSRLLCSLWRGQSACLVVSWILAWACSHSSRYTHTCPGSAAWTDLGEQEREGTQNEQQYFQLAGDDFFCTTDLSFNTHSCVHSCICGIFFTYCLEVKCHQLAACIPKHLRHIVGGVNSSSLRVDSTELKLVVP